MAWMNRTPIIIIELHDWMLPGEGTSLPFLKQVAQLDREFIYIGENVFSISRDFSPFAADSLSTERNNTGRTK